MAMVDGKLGDGDGPEGTAPFVSGADNDRDEYLAEDAVSDDQLAFEGENERLPWLDSDEDDDQAEATDGGRVLGLVVLALIALATIVGGIWWSTHRTTDPALVADGSIIAAPSQAYKEAPKNPGGKTFDGTGNTAFAVSEGQTRPAKLGEGSAPVVPPPGAATVKPGFDSVKPSAASASTSPAASASAHASTSAGTVTGPAVQVGAYSTRASAEAAWSRLSQQYSALSGQRHQTVEGKADIGTVFRLQALPGDASAAHALCAKLKSAGLACQVK
ncbi:MAG: SPOR domain-containing protein [Novosphingobium sp.]